MSVRLGRFVENRGVLPNSQFAYWKSQGTCDALFCVCPIQCKVHWRVGSKARFVQIAFGTSFDRVSYQGILYKLCSVGMGGSVLSVLTQSL